jgi:hypothetical protein
MYTPITVSFRLMANNFNYSVVDVKNVLKSLNPQES